MEVFCLERVFFVELGVFRSWAGVGVKCKIHI